MYTLHTITIVHRFIDLNDGANNEYGGNDEIRWQDNKNQLKQSIAQCDFGDLRDGVERQFL